MFLELSLKLFLVSQVFCTKKRSAMLFSSQGQPNSAEAAAATRSRKWSYQKLLRWVLDGPRIVRLQSVFFLRGVSVNLRMELVEENSSQESQERLKDTEAWFAKNFCLITFFQVVSEQFQVGPLFLQPLSFLLRRKPFQPVAAVLFLPQGTVWVHQSELVINSQHCRPLMCVGIGWSLILLVVSIGLAALPFRTAMIFSRPRVHSAVGNCAISILNIPITCKCRDRRTSYINHLQFFERS